MARTSSWQAILASLNFGFGPSPTFHIQNLNPPKKVQYSYLQKPKRKNIAETYHVKLIPRKGNVAWAAWLMTLQSEIPKSRKVKSMNVGPPSNGL